MLTSHKVLIEDVVEGDFLLDLDNGYVYEDPESDEYGVYTVRFNDAEGGECVLIHADGLRLNVGR